MSSVAIPTSELLKTLPATLQNEGVPGDFVMVQFNNAQVRRFNAPAANLSKFFEIYCNLANDKDVVLKYGELIGDKKELPLIGNLIFRFRTPQDYYLMDDFVPELVSCYQRVIEEQFRIDDDRCLTCIVLLRENFDEGLLHIRIQFPYCQVNRQYYRKFIRPALEKEFTRVSLLNLLVEVPEGSWANIFQDFDTSVPLYRSMNDEHIPPLFHDIYLADAEPFSEKRFNNISKTFFDPEEAYIISSNRCDGSFTAKFKPIELLPLLLSIHFCDQVMIPHEESACASTKEMPILIDFSNEDIHSDDPRKMFYFLIELLKPHRATEMHYWCDVGRAIQNIFKGEQGLEEWKRFTARGSRDIRECDSLYWGFGNTAGPNPLTIRTIGWYAKEDNPEIYQQWHNAWMQRAIEHALNLIDREVAQALWRYSWLDFIYSPSTKCSWYRFNDTFLAPCDENIVLRYISVDFSKLFERIIIVLRQEALTLDREADRNRLAEIADRYHGLIKKLGKNTFQNTILRQYKQYAIREHFASLQDADPKKFACNNGIIEIAEDKAVFREGKPEDFITKSTQNNFPTHYTWDTYEVKTVKRIFHQIMVGDRGLEDYFWRLVASLLMGRNPDKIFPICTGVRNNGKTIFAKFLQFAFGSYCVDMPVETISNKGGRAGEIRTDLTQAQSARVATVCEPSNNEIQTSVVKKFSGNDRQWCRSLYQEGGGMEQFYKLFLMCNEIPRFSHIEAALMIRLVIIPFLARFEWVAPATEEEQYATRVFPRDGTLEDRIPSLAPAFLWIAVQYFPRYCEAGLRDPPELVLMHTKEHWDSRDFYRGFIKECLERDEESSLSSTDLCSKFRTWFEENHGRNRKDVTLTPAIIERFSSIDYLGPWTNRRWPGWRLRKVVIDA
jgi:phage/plasmid-associated DNA primase